MIGFLERIDPVVAILLLMLWTQIGKMSNKLTELCIRLEKNDKKP